MANPEVAPANAPAGGCGPGFSRTAGPMGDCRIAQNDQPRGPMGRQPPAKAPGKTEAATKEGATKHKDRPNLIWDSKINDKPTVLSSDEFKKKSKGHEKGCFGYDSSHEESDRGVVTIKLRGGIYLDAAVPKTERPEVLKHEERHRADFKKLASQIREDIQQWLKAHKDPSGEDIQSWLDWFDYDVCVASAKYHRSIGAMVPFCIEPSGPRPK